MLLTGAGRGALRSDATLRHRDERMERLEVGMRERAESRGPRGLKSAKHPKLSRCGRRVDPTYANCHVSGARPLLKRMNVFAKISRHESKVDSTERGQDAKSLRIVQILRIRLEQKGVAWSESARFFLRLGTAMSQAVHEEG